MKAARGFSLIELVVGMVILGVLMSIAAPRFTDWLRNARVRTTAESVQNGLQLARTEAVRRNTTVRFQLVDAIDNTCALSAAGPHWVVSLDDPSSLCGTPASETALPRITQVRNSAEGANATVIAPAPSPPFVVFNGTVVFNGLGRPTPAPAANIGIDFSSTMGGTCMAVGGTVRCLRVVVSIGGQIRMCDPALTIFTPGDAQAC